MPAKYTFALIGCGRVARKHAKAVKHLQDRLEPVALVDGNVAAARKLSSDVSFALPENALFTSMEDMFASGIRPDIIAITTPSGLHYSMAKAAMENGAHIFLEKPMTLKLEEARELKVLADSLGRRIAMGHIYRFFPLVNLIREDILSGVYGRVLSSDVTVQWGHGQNYYDQAAWRGTWESDGGALMNQSIHALDLMLWLLGEKPLSVQGSIRRRLHDMEAEDYGTALFSLTDGSVLRLVGTTNTPEKLHHANFYISLEEAEIEAGITSGKPYIKAVNRQGKKCGKYHRRFLKQLMAGSPLKKIKAYANPHTGIYADLVAAIDHGEACRADADSGLSSVENILAVYKSALMGGQPVNLPLDDFSLQDMQGYFQGTSK